ncbi:MAG: hypothetical protein DRJ37_06480 [Thermoprotei archaeon]|nr:MAG: hypothetical protein DRJ37_06480 [Thermoprotei archaeon]
MKKIIVVFMATLILLAGVSWAQELLWMEDYDEAVRFLEESGKPLFTYFYSETCFYCEKFEKETLRDPGVVKLLEENFVLVMINARREAGLAHAYGIPGTPTVFVRLPNGTVIDYRLWENWHPGFMSPKELKEYLSFSLKYLKASKTNGKTVELSSTERTEKESESQPLAILPFIFVAGMISAFSPCILPLLPLLFVFQFKNSFRRIVLMNAGLILSFTLLGVVTGSIGWLLTSWRAILEKIAYIAMVGFGVFLLVDKLNSYLIRVSSVISNFVGRKAGSLGSDFGVFVFGLILGVLWFPCIGPIVGAVLVYIMILGTPSVGFLVMLIYAIGFALSIYLTVRIFEKAKARIDKLRGSKRKREEKKFRKKLMSRGRILEKLAGIFLIVLGVLMLSGYGEIFLLMIPTP